MAAVLLDDLFFALLSVRRGFGMQSEFQLDKHSSAHRRAASLQLGGADLESR